MTKIEWKKIPDFDYEVSNQGNVWSAIFKKNINSKIFRGYRCVRIHSECNVIKMRVDYLVSEAFGLKKRDILVHKNGNKLDDNLDNLLWLSYNDFFKIFGNNETWKEIEEFPTYFISSNGRLWGQKTETFLSATINQNGRLFTTINGKSIQIHIVVAKNFLGFSSGNIIHKNGDLHDNRVSNLDISKTKKISKKWKKTINKICPIPEGKNHPKFGNILVTSTGEIYNLSTKKYLSQTNADYMRVFINRKNYYVHRLVAETYLPSPLENQTQVNHIDGDKKNNNISNLEWSSPSENNKHSARILHKDVYKKKERPVISTDINGKEIEYSGVRNAALMINVNPGTITRCCKEGCKIKNLRWRYKI